MLTKNNTKTASWPTSDDPPNISAFSSWPPNQFLRRRRSEPPDVQQKPPTKPGGPDEPESDDELSPDLLATLSTPHR
jgi:hypothetical protein